MEDDTYGESFEYEGDVYVKCDNETQLLNLLNKWEYNTIEEFEKETGAKRTDILCKFFMIMGVKETRVYILDDGMDVDYKHRVFLDLITGDTYTGNDVLAQDPLESIWEVCEIDLTKDLKIGDTGYTRIREAEYDRENHTTDFVEIQRLK